MMNPEVKKIWVDALRSGEFEQGRGVLRRDDRYCCLGVLCELHRRSGAPGFSEWRIADGNCGIYKYAGQGQVLPSAVSAWAWIDFNPVLAGPEDPDLATASALNDGGVTFSEIADRIEKRL